MQTISFSTISKVGYFYSATEAGEFEAEFRTDSDGSVEYFKPSRISQEINSDKENELCAIIEKEIAENDKVRAEWGAWMSELCAEELRD